MIVKNCPITKKDSEVKLEYIVDKSSEYVSNTGSIHTGVDIECDYVYSVFDGVVIQICMLDEHMSVTVQYNGTYSVRFSHMKRVDCNAGQLIKRGDLIGSSDEFVHFELLTSYRSEYGSKVIVGDLELFKSDPIDIVLGKMKFEDTPNYSKNYNYALEGDYSTEPLDDISNMPISMIQELTNGVDPDADIH